MWLNKLCGQPRAIADRNYEAATVAYGLRPKQVPIRSAEDEILLNDQIPMLNGVLDRCKLPSGMAPQDWVAYLDEHVFFWATKKRLGDFLYTRQKRGYESVVFQVQTSALLTALPDVVEISMQNSGAPHPPKPSPRYRFTKLQRYDDCAHWFSSSGRRKPVVEVVVKERAVLPELLKLLPQGEWTPLVAEAKIREEEKKSRKR